MTWPISALSATRKASTLSMATLVWFKAAYEGVS